MGGGSPPKEGEGLKSCLNLYIFLKRVFDILIYCFGTSILYIHTFLSNIELLLKLVVESDNDVVVSGNEFFLGDNDVDSLSLKVSLF